MESVIIIGSGPAGYSAAIYLARAGLQPLLLTGDLPGGLLTQTSVVENFPGFPDGIDGFELVENMWNQAEKFGGRRQFATVIGVELVDGGPQHLFLADGEVLEAHAVIIATGARPRYLGVEGEEELRGHGVSYCATCDGAFFKNKAVVVIGGGDSAMEEALHLTHLASEVHLIHRRQEFRASPIMVDRVLDNNKIHVHLNSVVEKINRLGDEKQVGSVTLRQTDNDEISEITCDGVFVTVGHLPNTDIFSEALERKDGYIVLSDKDTSHTALQGVFAAGDCADPRYRQAVTAAGMGCRAALDCQRWLETLKHR